MEAARIGIKVKCIKDDPADEYYGFSEELRWHIGDELIVTDIHIAPYGTFLCNYKGQNINMKRCEFVDANIEENLESVRLLSKETGELPLGEKRLERLRNLLTPMMNLPLFINDNETGRLDDIIKDTAKKAEELIPMIKEALRSDITLGELNQLYSNPENRS